MTFSTFSEHAPTGLGSSYKYISSPNQYAPEGRAIGFPSKVTIYVNSISEVDGSVSVSEEHTADQVIGSRLYLYHRPMVDATGGISTITTSDGVINSSSTNAKQGYVEYSSDPTGTFLVSYTAAPDCVNVWQINKMQDDIMEIENKIGPDTLKASTGEGYNLRNLKHTILDKPTDSIASLYGNYVSLNHLNSDLRISSTDDSNLTGILGDSHTIQIGRKIDSVYFDTTGFKIESTQGPDLKTTINLGTQTGDQIYYMGSLSGAGQATIGGPEWSDNYSGVPTPAVQAMYTGAMLRVNGDIACLGDIKSVGSIVVENVTGETSSIIGDFKVTDELFVYGISHLVGPVQANETTVNRDLTVHGDIISANTRGSGGNGQTLFDNLDPSEIAISYKPVTKKNISKGVIKAPKYRGAVEPKRNIYGADYVIGPNNTCGDIFNITGILNAAVSSSGTHDSIIQVNFTSNPQGVVTGKFTKYDCTGNASGIISEGLLDPGSLWIDIIGGSASGYSAPIYNFTVESKTVDNVLQLNVFTPSAPTQSTASNDSIMMYSPGCEPYKYISYTDGAAPTFKVNATSSDPIWIGFDDEVRVLSSSTANISMQSALEKSVSGLSTPSTGCCYIVATSNGIDPESAPNFLARATPFTMPGEALIGEATLLYDGSLWTLREGVSYRPGGYYDSSWIPVQTTDGGLSTGIQTSGRMTPVLNAATATGSISLYFNHELGADMDFARMNVDLYIASHNTNSYDSNSNKFKAFKHSLFGQDLKHGVNDGTFNRHSLTESYNDFARMFYIDGKVLGIEIETPVVTSNDYIRVVAERKN